ncbi:H-NS histone family protein [Rhodobacteraceae bacterium THAF1]|uniref:H-NS histone family protein n=1 Tax=Palleronia sp. THAF1 TaxID=2587842 RepID=UPI000F3BB867|nr:H-NS histone family protein [Palleronia sp. THAF1]QFU07865.1 H-NS histone family protein [Palleronia sp. THAF1]VDC25699.1 H-NS histone family protein [Rhodobacteraceae bacterium THAF1]
MAKNLEDMSRDELLAMKADVDRAIASLDDRRRAEARAAAEKAARELGFSLDELTATQKKSGKKNPAKYRNPEDPRQTWSGRGRQPAWFKEAIANGKDASDFEI